jgi:hypothetical protein
MIKLGLIFARLSGLAKRIPWQAWAAIGLAFAAMLYGGHREQQGRFKGREEIQAKWDRQKAADEKARRAEEARQAKLTKEADRAVIKKTSAERDGVERFIARGGVRNACPWPDHTAIPSPGEREGMREAPVMDVPVTVSVIPEDVRICTENTIKAEAWRELLLGLEAK